MQLDGSTLQYTYCRHCLRWSESLVLSCERRFGFQRNLFPTACTQPSCNRSWESICKRSYFLQIHFLDSSRECPLASVDKNRWMILWRSILSCVIQQRKYCLEETLANTQLRIVADASTIFDSRKNGLSGIDHFTQSQLWRKNVRYSDRLR